MTATVNAVRQRKSESQAKAGTERRRWARLPLRVPVFLRGVDEAGKHFLEFSTALNVSAGGMLLAARRELSQLDTVSLEIPSVPLPPIAPVGSFRTFKARAVRDLISGRCHLVALKFSRPML